MIRCHLSRLMGEHKLKIVEVARRTGLNRSSVTAMYYETAQKIDLGSIDKLCTLFDCEVEDLFERTRD
jgi:putative transcriptional regulator